MPREGTMLYSIMFPLSLFWKKQALQWDFYIKPSNNYFYSYSEFIYCFKAVKQKLHKSKKQDSLCEVRPNAFQSNSV